MPRSSRLLVPQCPVLFCSGATVAVCGLWLGCFSACLPAVADVCQQRLIAHLCVLFVCWEVLLGFIVGGDGLCLSVSNGSSCWARQGGCAGKHHHGAEPPVTEVEHSDLAPSGTFMIGLRRAGKAEKAPLCLPSIKVSLYLLGCKVLPLLGWAFLVGHVHRGVPLRG